MTRIIIFLTLVLNIYAFAKESLVTCDLIRIVDGDTAIFICENWQKAERVRLTGYNSPEKCQPGFEEATEWLTQTLTQGTITLNVRARDQYRRIVADVFVEGVRVKAPKQHRAKRIKCNN